MKKFLAIILALTIVLGLCAACASKDAEVDDKYGADGKITIQVGLGSSAKIISFGRADWLQPGDR